MVKLTVTKGLSWCVFSAKRIRVEVDGEWRLKVGCGDRLCYKQMEGQCAFISCEGRATRLFASSLQAQSTGLAHIYALFSLKEATLTRGHLAV